LPRFNLVQSIPKNPMNHSDNSNYSNRATRLLYESGQGWGKEILPFLGKPEIRTLTTVNKGFHHAIHRAPIRKGWDWQFQKIKGDIVKEIKSPCVYPESILSIENELLVSGRLSHVIHVISKESGKVLRQLKCKNKDYGVWNMFTNGTEIYVLLFKTIIVLKSSLDDTIVREWACMGLDMTFTSKAIIVLYERILTFYDYYGAFLYTLTIPMPNPCKSMLAIGEDIALFDAIKKQVCVLSGDGNIKYNIPCPFAKTQWVSMTFIPDIEELIVCDNNSSTVGALNTHTKESRIIHSNFFHYPHDSVYTTEGLYIVVRNHDKIYLLH
jgi:hypothetical protein